MNTLSRIMHRPMEYTGTPPMGTDATRSSVAGTFVFMSWKSARSLIDCSFFASGQERCGGAVDWAWHMVLPWFAFALLFALTVASALPARAGL